MVYIQRKDTNSLETVDEFPTMREARKVVREYRLSDPSASYYLSSRACKVWRENSAVVDKIQQK
jgi:hypothetical protein